MDIKIEDVLKINFVLVGIQLLNTEEQRAGFASKVGTEVSEVPSAGIRINFTPPGIPQTSLQPESGQTLMLNRDRIVLDLTPGRSIITREYPNKVELARLCQVAGIAMALSDLNGQELRAYGFNIEVIYELTSGEDASQFMANCIFAPSLFHEAGFQVVGGSPRLNLLREGQIWNVNIEPRFGDPSANKVFASLNLHKDDGSMPDDSIVAASLDELWNQAHSIMESLREGV